MRLLQSATSDSYQFIGNKRRVRARGSCSCKTQTTNDASRRAELISRLFYSGRFGRQTENRREAEGVRGSKEELFVVRVHQPALSSCWSRSASQMRARVVASVVRSRASLIRTAFIAGGIRMLSCAVLSCSTASSSMLSRSLWSSTTSAMPASKRSSTSCALAQRATSASLAPRRSLGICLVFISATSDNVFSVFSSSCYTTRQHPYCENGIDSIRPSFLLSQSRLFILTRLPCRDILTAT